MSSVSIATKPLVYQTFRFIDNKIWNAIGEYIDNAISSFLYNRDLLERINPNKKLTVKVNFDLEDDKITIEDNAFGIDSEHYEKAFQLAELPLDTSNLNEFGMGMKVSSIWLCDIWIVESKAYGEKSKRLFTFNLKDVIKNQIDNVEYEESECNTEEHYTKITLTELSKKAPSRRQIKPIKDHLADIYLKFIRDGILDLYVDGELLKIKKLEVLKAPYYKEETGEVKEWIHYIDLPRTPKMENGVQVGWYSVKGYIGLLATQSTSVDNGLFLFHKGRVVDNSNEGKYRPQELCGEVGSPRYKRVFGELELEGYDVTYTKNAFNEDDDFHQLLLDIKQDILDSGEDFFGQAQHYTKPKTPKETADYATKFITSIVNSKSKTTEKKGKEENITPQPIVVPELPTIEEIEEPEITEPKFFLAEPQIATVDILGLHLRLRLGAVENENEKKLFTLKEIKEGEEYEATINWKNDYFKHIDFSIEEQLDSVAYFVKVMVLTEIHLKLKGVSNSWAFRNTFNQLFGNVQ